MRGTPDDAGWVEIELDVDDHARSRRGEAAERVAPAPSAAEPPGRPDPLRFPAEHPHAAVVLAAAVLVVVAVVAFGVGRAGRPSSGATPVTATTTVGADETDEADDAADAPRSTLPPVTTVPRTTERPTTTTQPLISISELGGPVIGEPVGMRIVGLTDDGDVATLDLDTGQLVVTDLDHREVRAAEATVIALDGVTVVQPWDGRQGVIVPRLGAPTELAGAVQGGATLFPGPLPDTLWVTESAPLPPYTNELAVIGLDGVPVGPRVPIDTGWAVASDGRGQVYAQTAGGVYVVGLDNIAQVSTGDLVGWGANHVLVKECDESLRCGFVLVATATGERTDVEDAITGDGSTVWEAPSVAPDGSAIVVYGSRGGAFGLQLVDLRSGEVTSLPPTRGGVASLGWSPDGRFLASGIGGDVRVLDRATGVLFELPDGAPSIVRFVAVPTVTSGG